MSGLCVLASRLESTFSSAARAAQWARTRASASRPRGGLSERRRLHRRQHHRADRDHPQHEHGGEGAMARCAMEIDREHHPPPPVVAALVSVLVSSIGGVIGAGVRSSATVRLALACTVLSSEVATTVIRTA